MKLFTIGGGDLSKFDDLKSSAKLSGAEIHYIGNPTWSGYFDKIYFALEKIKELPKDDIVCFIDGFDVVSVGGLEEIKQKFLDYNCDLLLSSEMNCWPPCYKDAFPIKKDCPTQFKYINTGGIIGYVHALLDLWQWKPIDEIKAVCARLSDQGYCYEYYAANHDKKNIKIDSMCNIFLSMYGYDWNEFYIQNGRIFNTVLKNSPCVLHFNGNSWKDGRHQNVIPKLIDKMRLSIENPSEKYTIANYGQLFSIHSYMPMKQLL
jgi:hypothetical protein